MSEGNNRVIDDGGLAFIGREASPETKAVLRPVTDFLEHSKVVEIPGQETKTGVVLKVEEGDLERPRVPGGIFEADIKVPDVYKIETDNGGQEVREETGPEYTETPLKAVTLVENPLDALGEDPATRIKNKPEEFHPEQVTFEENPLGEVIEGPKVETPIKSEVIANTQKKADKPKGLFERFISGWSSDKS